MGRAHLFDFEGEDSVYWGARSRLGIWIWVRCAGGERTTDRLAPGVASANEGMGGTGGGGLASAGVGGGECERERLAPTIEDERRWPYRGEDGDVDSGGDAIGDALCLRRVPNSSPSIQSSDWAFVLRRWGSSGLTVIFLRSGEPIRRGGIGGSSGCAGR